jgi:hypothetical protein
LIRRVAPLALALAGCHGQYTIACSGDAFCDTGPGGRCLASPSSASRFCAFADKGCAPSGLRWDATAGDALAGECVGAPRDAAMDLPPSDLASVDVAASDQAPIDLAVPDRAAGDPPPSTFCSRGPAHTFCDDFDTELVGNFTLWDSAAMAGGQFSYTSQAVSPPNALDAHADAPAGFGPYLTKGFGVASRVHLEADVHANCQSLGTDLLMIVFQVAGGATVTASFYQSPGGAHIAVDCAGMAFDAAACNGDLALSGINLSNWDHYALDVDVGMGAFQISIGAPDGGVKSMGLPFPPLAASPFQLDVGVGFHAQLNNACDADFDNVVLDAS